MSDSRLKNSRLEVNRASVAIHTAVSAALFVGPLVLNLTGAGLDVAFLIPAWSLQAIGLLGLSNAAHECVHGHYVRRRVVDRWAGRLFHLPILLNFEAHKRYHLGHHAHTGEDEDPEGIFDYRKIPSVYAYLLRFARWAVPPSPLHCLNQRIALGAFMAPFESGSKPVVINEILLACFLGFTLAGTLLAGPAAVIASYWIPVLIIFPAVAFFTALPEHSGLDREEAGLSRTRTILLPNWFSWLIWSFNYHTAHHARPNAPFHQLENLHEELGPSVVYVTRGYSRFHLALLGAIRSSSGQEGTPSTGVSLGAVRDRVGEKASLGQSDIDFPGERGQS